MKNRFYEEELDQNTQVGQFLEGLQDQATAQSGAYGIQKAFEAQIETVMMNSAKKTGSAADQTFSGR